MRSEKRGSAAALFLCFDGALLLVRNGRGSCSEWARLLFGTGTALVRTGHGYGSAGAEAGAGRGSWLSRSTNRLSGPMLNSKSTMLRLGRKPSRDWNTW